MTIPQQVLFATARTVIPGSQTFDSGSGNFTVPVYNTLTIELWGGGAAGGIHLDTTRGGTNGNPSTVSTLSLSAGGGLRSADGANGGVGGTASGGNTTNTNGNVGGPSTLNFGLPPSGFYSGAGGSAPNGGAGGVGVYVPDTTGNANGNPGTAPGGGGSGAAETTGTGPAYTHRGDPGGGSGAYVKHVVTLGTGPAPGALLAYAVAASVSAFAGTPQGGSGAAGRVKFTWA